MPTATGFASGDELPSSGSALRAGLKVAFEDEELEKRILDAADRHRELANLFHDIAQNVMHSRGQGRGFIPVTGKTKKRKLEHDVQQVHSHGETQTQPEDTKVANEAVEDPQLLFSCKDVSFQIPMRKKLKLDFVADIKSPTRQEIRLINQSSKQTEYTLRPSQIEQAFCMAVPDKQARQTNFVLYPKADEGLEPVVFSLNETAPAAGTWYCESALEEGDTYVSVTERALERMLKLQGLSLVKPTEKEFASAIPQSHRRGEKGYHVRAHRGSKEGYLFFLPVGILFAFKKPLTFFPFSAIDSISYTSVLQRTFNLVITTTTEAPKPGSTNDETKIETEFSMLDQADFAGIDAYVKRHGLHDASMAAQRRAKAYNVNKSKSDLGNELHVNGDGGEEEESELAKAERDLQDAEDEEEEDYEASGGESDGEGEESEGDEDGEGYEEGGEGEYDDEDEEDGEGEELEEP